MTEKQPYSYTVLRYIHDVMTGEFVNVGVVLCAPLSDFLGVRSRSTIGRLKDVFPDLDRKAFKSAMKSIERSVARIDKEKRKSTLFRSTDDALHIGLSILPNDDSSLQWSKLGTGITNDPQTTLDRLFDRMVARYDSKFRERRTEYEIWRPVRQKLEERHLAPLLQEKVFHGGSDEIVFEHARKNGVWHCYEPISLDLVDADGIKEKARRWLGHLTAVEDSPERFKPYFILGAPRGADLAPAYKSAKAILRKSPFAPEIFEEDEIEGLVDQIEQDVRRENPEFYARIVPIDGQP